MKNLYLQERMWFTLERKERGRVGETGRRKGWSLCKWGSFASVLKQLAFFWETKSVKQRQNSRKFGILEVQGILSIIKFIQISVYFLPLFYGKPAFLVLYNLTELSVAWALGLRTAFIVILEEEFTRRMSIYILILVTFTMHRTFPLIITLAKAY